MATNRYNAIFAVVLCAFLTTTSCEENNSVPKMSNSQTAPQTKAGQAARVTNYTFDGSEGDPITLEVARGWISNYTGLNPNATKAHFFSTAAIQSILSKSGCLGIRIYYSIDDNSNQALLLVGTNNTGKDMVPFYGINGKSSFNDLTNTTATDVTATAAEAAVNDSIPGATFSRWASNYVQNNPSGLQAHFFGYQIIKDILAEKGCVGIRIYYALNDAGVQQLLLIGVTQNGTNLLPAASAVGRVEGGDNTIGDASVPCPTYCSGS
jgi:hypothetical protein